MQMIETKFRHFMFKSCSDGLMTGKDCENSYLSFLNFKLFVVENTHLRPLVCFNFCFFMLGSSEGFDSQVFLPYFLSICAIKPLIL